MNRRKIILLSGGFDPIHSGHIDMIFAAAELGDVIAAVNSDEWLMRKKGFVFMPFDQRIDIVSSLRCVEMAIPAFDDDDTVCETIRDVKPDMFGNGGDRTALNTPEIDLCERLGIEMVWGLGKEKTESSSELVRKAAENMSKTIIRYKTTDAPEPKNIAGIVMLRSPMEMVMRPGESRPIDLGISFNVPVELKDLDPMVKEGIRLRSPGRIVMPGEPIKPTFHKSESTPVSHFERGRSLCIAVPLVRLFDLVKDD